MFKESITPILENLVSLRKLNTGRENLPLLRPPEQYLKPSVLPETPRLLLTSSQLWTPPLKGVNYTPRRVVEEILMRRDGKAEEPDGFTVYINTEMKTIHKIWGIYPDSYFEKQRHQLWEYKYVWLFCFNIERQLTSENPQVNKIVYTFKSDIKIEKLEITFAEAISKMTKAYKNYVKYVREQSNTYPSDTSKESGWPGVVTASRRGPRHHGHQH